MILMEPFLLMTLHFSQIGLTEDLTFISILLSWANKSRRIIISPLFIKYKGMVFMQSHEYFPVYGAVSGKNDYALQLLVSPGDPSLAQIIRGKFHRDPVSGQDADIIHAEFAADMRQHLVSVLQFHLEHGVRKFLDYFSFQLDHVCFRHSIPLLIRLIAGTGSQVPRP